MSEKKTNKPAEKSAADRIFTAEGILKEARRVRWPSMKSEGGEPGVIRNTLNVLAFSAVSAAILGAADALAGMLLKLIF